MPALLPYHLAVFRYFYTAKEMGRGSSEYIIESYVAKAQVRHHLFSTICCGHMLAKETEIVLPVS